MKYLGLFSIGVVDPYASQCLDFVNSTVCLYETEPAFFHPEMLTFEINGPVHGTAGGCQRNCPWHLSRVLDLEPRKSTYSWDGNGRDVDVYVLDTWVDCDHKDFEDRCRELRRFANHRHNARPAHGTHVAGLIGSREHGAAKRANIKSVIVLDDDGTGDLADVAKALEFVKREITRARNRRHIVNLSLKGGKSRVLDQVVREMESLAIVVISAGNDNVDACDYSPNGSAVVGATNLENKMSKFSNFGRCVSILAPGENILSLCPDQHECWMSGTSMAAPLTAGALASFWESVNTNDPQLVWSMFKKQAVRVGQVKPGTSNSFIRLNPKTKCPLLVMASGCGSIDLGELVFS